MQERHICLQQKGKKIEDGILCKTKVWQMQFLCFIVLLLSQGIFCRKCLLLTKWKRCNSYCWYIHSYSCGRYHNYRPPSSTFWTEQSQRHLCFVRKCGTQEWFIAPFCCKVLYYKTFKCKLQVDCDTRHFEKLGRHQLSSFPGEMHFDLWFCQQIFKFFLGALASLIHVEGVSVISRLKIASKRALYCFRLSEQCQQCQSYRANDWRWCFD